MTDNIEKDQKILRIAMINAYKLITGQMRYEDLLDKNDHGMWLPDGFQDNESIPSLIEYFEGTEEYEICQELLDIKNNLEKTNEDNELTKIFNNTQWIPTDEKK
tara:strand:- start:695 stop:1006 length:312 start_codon:yes stop_codon:yes gene_type:complete